jgi:hypothetical protein
MLSEAATMSVLILQQGSDFHEQEEIFKKSDSYE